MKERLWDEGRRLWAAWRALDQQTIWVLIIATALVIIHDAIGGRRFFQETIADWFHPDHQGLMRWAWRFGTQGILGFLVPIVVLRYAFKQRWHEMGLGLGDWKLASTLALLYIPLVVVGTWVLSDTAAFQTKYPHFSAAASNWRLFFIYESLFLFYWIGWEYLWRGFVLFGTARTFGHYAIFIQMVPFAVLHISKPLPEAMLSILGGVALGALVWRCRSFWIAVPIHAAQMMILDFWCTMRVRTEVEGIGLGALWQMFGGG